MYNRYNFVCNFANCIKQYRIMYKYFFIQNGQQKGPIFPTDFGRYEITRETWLCQQGKSK